ncbi:chlororespiratory reduction protein 7 [Trichothermofontia sp.]
MPDPILYQEDYYVVLESDRPEEFLTAAAMLEKLKTVLAANPDNIPPDVRRFPTIEAQAQYLFNTACELDVGPGKYLQWYAVRLEKSL